MTSTRRTRAFLLAGAAVGLLVAGCGSSDNPGSATGTPTSPTSSSMPASSATVPSTEPAQPTTPPTTASSAGPTKTATAAPVPSGTSFQTLPMPGVTGVPGGTPTEVSPERWTAITDDLAKRGVTGTPELVLAQAVTWPDGSWGCPEPGMAYTQVLVDGAQVLVSVDGVTYDYRFGGADQPKLCEPDR